MQSTNRLFSQYIYTNTPRAPTCTHTHTRTAGECRRQPPLRKPTSYASPERETHTHMRTEGTPTHTITGSIRVKVSSCDRAVKFAWQTAARCYTLMVRTSLGAKNCAAPAVREEFMLLIYRFTHWFMYFSCDQNCDLFSVLSLPVTGNTFLII